MSAPHTPASNTGVTVAWAGIHWFAGTIKHIPADAVASIVGEFMALTPTALDRGGYGYTASYVIGSARVYWSPERPDVFVSLCGEACEQLGIPNLVALATALDLQPNSRLDFAYDIDNLTPNAFAEAFRAGDVVTRIHRGLNEDTGRLRGIEYRSNHEGDTVYLGSRHSERFIRVYDRRGPTRLEGEWKGKRAVDFWARLLATVEDEWSREAMSELRAFIDFRDRSYAERPDCCPLLGWWAVIVGDAGRSCTTHPRTPKTMADVTDWVRHAVAPSLAMVRDAYGHVDFTRWVRTLLADGTERYSAKPERVALVKARRSYGGAPLVMT